MKDLDEIPECSKLLDEMFEEFDKLPKPKTLGLDVNWKEQKKIRDRYWIKLQEAYKKYMTEHPEELEEK